MNPTPPFPAFATALIRLYYSGSRSFACGPLTLLSPNTSNDILSISCFKFSNLPILSRLLTFHLTACRVQPFFLLDYFITASQEAPTRTSERRVSLSPANFTQEVAIILNLSLVWKQRTAFSWQMLIAHIGDGSPLPSAKKRLLNWIEGHIKFQ